MSRYNVYLADDERMIREGIATLIPWEKLSLHFLGAAPNGRIAYDSILESKADIVITDIKMPIMNGLELIKLTLEHCPEVRFIVLSGHNEFEFATQAMQYGVKHYLLKPCNETEIIQVLNKVVEELDQTRNITSYLKNIEGQLAEAMPIRIEKLILNHLLNPTASKDRVNNDELTSQMGEELNLILIQLTDHLKEEQTQALYQMIDNWMGGCRIVFSMGIEDKFVLIVESEPWVNFALLSSLIKNGLSKGQDEKLNLVISETCRLEDLGVTYQDALNKLKYRDYFGQTSVFTKEIGAKLPSGESKQLIELVDQVVLSIKLGNIEALQEGLTVFFDTLRDIRGEIHLTIGYCIELITEIARQTDPVDSNVRMQRISPVLQMKKLEELHQYVLESSLKRARESEQFNQDKNRQLVQRMVHLMHEHLSNKELSLQWLAKKFFYMSVDYLGKLFRKEKKERFSQYLTRIRMERAIEMIISDADCKLYEVAQASGFGDDSQYFSNVFKRYTGVSPSEYKKTCRNNG